MEFGVFVATKIDDWSPRAPLLSAAGGGGHVWCLRGVPSSDRFGH